MQTIETFDVAVAVIMHFAEDESLAEASGRRLIHYQVMIDPNDPSLWSGDTPETSEFMRFQHGKYSEVHGWVRVSSVVVDALLRKITDEELEEAA